MPIKISIGLKHKTGDGYVRHKNGTVAREGPQGAVAKPTHTPIPHSSPSVLALVRERAKEDRQKSCS